MTDQKLTRSDRDALDAVKWYISVIGGAGVLGVILYAFWEFFGAMF